MKLKDFLSVIDLRKLDDDDLNYLRRHLSREPDRMTSADLWAMYGDHDGELRREQRRADLDKTRAEIAKLKAEAERARTEADAQRRGTSRRS